MTTFTVTSGVTSSGITLSAGDFLLVSSGGIASATTVSGGGTEIVFVGGSASFSIVSSGGAEVISGGTASGTMLVGGQQVINSGGTAADTIVDSGGVEFVSSGGVATATVVNSGGDEFVFSGGTASATTLTGGAEIVFDGGVASGTTVQAGAEIVSSGGTAAGATVSAGGVQIVLDGGTTLFTTVSSGGGLQVSSGGIASSTTVSSGGSDVVTDGGSVIFTIVDSGGSEVVSSGGTAIATTVNDGGAAILLSAGISISGIVNSGGAEFVSSGATATATTINSGGAAIVFDGGQALGATILDGGTEVVSSGGTASGASVSAGGNEVVLDGGLAEATAIGAGGFENVSSGGAASGTVVGSSGLLTVFSGGAATATLVNSGGADVVSGGTVLLTTVASGGSEVVQSGGTSIQTTVNSGASETVLGASVSATIDGLAFVSSGGIALSGIVDGGGAFLVLSGGATSAVVLNGGAEIISDTGLGVATTVNSGGSINLSSGGTGSATVVNSGGSEFVVSGGTALGTLINSGGLEAVDPGGTVIGSDLQQGGAIDIRGFGFDSGGTANLDPNTDIVTIVENGITITAQLSGDYTGEFFHLSDDLGGGTLVTVDGTPCYCLGTRILTPRGEVEVEKLCIGDRVLNHKGEARPIRWIGRRSYAGRFAAANRDVMPILIRAGALTDGVPRRDLMVSPNHAMYIDDVLIPADGLVNGASIVRVAEIDRVEYFHIELESHDVILAEGALSETFVDDDSRGMFHNAAEFGMLYPGASRSRPVYCAPRVEDGELLEAVRQRLAARALNAEPKTTDAVPVLGKLVGNLDTAGRERISGWARDRASPNAPVRLRIYDNDVVIGEIVADLFRPDLKAAGVGSGRHGFELEFPGGLSPLVRHVIHVRRAADGRDIPNTPWTLKAEPGAVPVAITATSANPHEGCPHEGCVDQATRERISGWARDPRDPAAPVALQILDNGVPVARVLANLYRPDLEQAGYGGRHAFDIVIPGGLSPLARHLIQVRTERDGIELDGSPTIIEAANSFDANLEQTVANAVASVSAPGEQERVLSFILAQADRLRQQRADADAQRVERQTYRKLQRQMGPQAAGLREPERRALVLDTRYPGATDDAGSGAILSHITALQRLGYAVSFAAAEDTATAPETIAALEAQGIECPRAPFYSSVEDVLRRQAVCFDLVYLHRAEIASRYLSLARAYFPLARIVYSVADLRHVRLERQAAVEERPELLAAARQARLMECTAAWLADAVIAHSAAEADVLRALVPEANVHVVPWHVPVAAGPSMIREAYDEDRVVAALSLAVEGGTRGSAALAG